jgi:hypothetical protein
MLSPKKMFISDADVERIRKAPDFVRLKTELCDFLNILRKELDLQTTMVASDVASSAVGSIAYLGDPSTDGSWRFIISGGKLLIQIRVLGDWQTSFAHETPTG